VKALIGNPAFSPSPSHWPTSQFATFADDELWNVIVKLNGDGMAFRVGDLGGKMATRGIPRMEGDTATIGSLYSSPDFFLDLPAGEVPRAGMGEMLAYRRERFAPVVVVYPVEISGEAVPMPAILHRAVGSGRQAWAAAGIESDVSEFLRQKARESMTPDPDRDDVAAAWSRPDDGATDWIAQ
jgi:hypothetical protein